MKRISVKGRDRTTRFRSDLEASIADELDEQGVVWTYEEPVILPNGQSPRYLPDFTIKSAPRHLGLPRWVEGKPQQFLYDLRDATGVTRRCGEKFQGSIPVDDADAAWLRRRDCEMWKAKALAEITGEPVLVIGGVGGHQLLSIEMRPTEIIFSREHPFVNWTGLQRKRERDHRARQWQAEQDEARLRWRRVEQEREAAIARVRRDTLASALPDRQRGANRHDADCGGCGVRVWAGMGSLYCVPQINDQVDWFVLCDRCRCDGGRRR